MRRFLMALPLAAAVAACSAPSPVDEIVASNLAARGGLERIEALRSLRMTGTAAASDGRVARVVREMKRPDMVRLEFVAQGTTSVFAHSGDVGWQVAPLQGQFEPRVVSPESDAMASLDQRDIEGPLVNWRGKGHAVQLLGREELPGGEAFKLQIALADGGIRYDYVDVVTRQVVRSDFSRIVRGHAVQLVNTFSDFREVDGLVFPHRIETTAADRPGFVVITIDSIELDPELDDAEFEFPG